MSVITFFHPQGKSKFGAEIALMEEVKALINDGFECIVILGSKGKFFNELKTITIVEVVPFQTDYTTRAISIFHRFKIVINMFCLLRALYLVKIKYRTDMIWVNTSLASFGLWVGSFLNLKTIYRPHEAVDIHFKFKKITPKIFLPSFIFYRTTVFSPSAFIAQHVSFQGVFNDETSYILHQPVTSVSEKKDHNKSYPPAGLYLGSLSPNKNCHKLLLALMLIDSPKNSQRQFYFYGKGSEAYICYLNSLAKQLKYLSVEIINSYQESIEKSFLRADFTVTASKHEAFGRTVVEGIIFGLPAILPASGAFVEFDKGVTFAKDDTINGLSEAIQLNFDQKISVSKNVSAYYQHKFSPQKFTKKVRSLLIKED